MSRRSGKPKVTGRDPRLTSSPAPAARLTRSVSLFLLTLVVLVVAVMMLSSLVGFVLEPDPDVRAGPMYVTLALITGATLLMAALTLNATYRPFLSRRRVNDMSLVMWSMLVTGLVTGVLIFGEDVTAYVARAVVAGIAFVFIAMQHSRLERARTAPPAERTDASAEQPSTPAAEGRPPVRSRQRRGGRKH
jgi:hypothetical protein